MVLGDERELLNESSTDPIKAPMVEAEKDDDNDSVISGRECFVQCSFLIVFLLGRIFK